MMRAAFGRYGGTAAARASAAADVPEIQAGVEVLHQVEDVALGLAERIPPASSVVVDDQDLALTPPVFQGAPSALAGVELQPLLRRGGAIHAGSVQLQFGIASNRRLSRSSASARAHPIVTSPPSEQEASRREDRHKGKPECATP